jgi:uncharacterized protein
MSEGERREKFAPGRHQIDAYGRGGFRFAGMSHQGSILALPSGIAAWPVNSILSLTAGDLDLVLAEQPPVELLLIGTGREIAFLSNDVRERVRSAGIGVDVMQTGAASRTYNVLVAENRRVAAALVAVD